MTQNRKGVMCIMAMNKITALLCFSAIGTSIAINAATFSSLSRQTLLDKIRGGWAGQMIGVAYGAPTEFQSNGRIGEWNLVWKPGMLENTIHQDDLYVEMTFAKVMDDFGLDATCEQYGEAFKNSQYWLWHANAGARRALNQGIKAPWSGHPKFNFHANDIDFQIEADFIGLMCPGLPRESNKYCDRVGRVMNFGDGLYGGMFTCGMYATAFFETNPRRVVEGGLACIPSRSEYALLIKDLARWHAEYPSNWRHVWRLVQDKWDKNDACPEGALAPFNIDAKLNGAYIAFGLLFGNGDFEKTMEISTRCGQDSDCNPSSAAGVLGVILGYEQIPAKFKTEMPSLENKKFSYTQYSFNDIVKSTEARALKIISQTGGNVTDSAVVVKRQKPKAPRLEQWSPGVPDKKLKATDPAFVYSGAWETDKDSRTSRSSGSEVSLKFYGRALALTGALNQEGGQAEVYLDGKKIGIADAYIVERTSDSVLWNVYGLKLGEHEIRLVTTGLADPRSKGHHLTLEGAVVYR